MLENISLIAQSSIRIINNEGNIIYFDPFKIQNGYKDADYIFITHPHYDHFSPDDIIKIRKLSTKIIAPYELEKQLESLDFNDDNILLVKPNNTYLIDNLNFSTIPSYNLNKEFHKKEYGWVGYLISVDNKNIYIAGDTDNTPEARNVKCDIAFVPVGGTYTCNYQEAVDLIKSIRPEIAIPIHYQTIVGSVSDANKFKKILENEVEVEILMK